MKATHNGTCQVCGRQHANTTRGLAKHGYTVQWGYFQGTCRGAGNLPVEKSTELLDNTVKRLDAEADRLLAMTAEDIKFVHVRVYGRSRNPEVRSFDREQWDAWTAEGAEGQQKGYRRSKFSDAYSFAWMVERELADRHGQARSMQDHARMLRGLKADRYGKPLLPRMSREERTRAQQLKKRGAAERRQADRRERQRKEAERDAREARWRTWVPFSCRARVGGAVPMTRREWLDLRSREGQKRGTATASPEVRVVHADGSVTWESVAFVDDARTIEDVRPR